MPDRRGLFRVVQLILDRRSAKELERDAQRALDQGTDPKKATRNLRRVESGFGRLRSVAVKVGVTVGSIWVVEKVLGYAKAVFQVGRAIFQLGADVGAVRNQFETVFGAETGVVDAFIQNFRRLAGLTAREAERLAARSGSMAQGFGLSTRAAAAFSREVLELAGDLASFNNVPTAQAAELIQSALIGNTEAARSLGIAFTAADVQARALADTGKASAADLTQAEKALAALRVMTERAGPQIGDLARTQNDADNQAKQLAASIAQVRESLAAALVGGTRGTTIFADLRDVFQSLDRWIQNNSTSISAWTRIAVKAAVEVGRAFVGLGRVVKNAIEVIQDVATIAISSVLGSVLDLFNIIPSAINALIEQVNRIPGVDIEFRLGTIPVDQFFHMASGAASELKEDLRELGSGLGMVAGGFVGVARAATAAARAQDEAAAAGRRAAGGAGTDAPDMAAPTIGLARSVDPALLERAGGRLLEEAAQNAAERARESFADIEAAATHAAFGVAGAWQDAFGLVIEGFDNVGAAAEALARGIGGALLGGLAEYASGKVAENVALAAEEVAKGLAAAANPFLAATAPAHFAAAKAHGLTALKWSVLAGAAGAAQSAVAGGGRGGLSGGVPTGARDPGGRLTERAQLPGPEIHIHVDGVDPDNPRHQDLIHETERKAIERWGGTVVRHGRRSA